MEAADVEELPVGGGGGGGVLMLKGFGCFLFLTSW